MGSSSSLHIPMIVLVPQGAEYQAVSQGLRSAPYPLTIRPIPVGIQPVQQWLENWQQTAEFQQATHVIVMGLCGSLNPKLAIGDAVLYHDCLDLAGNRWQCHPLPPLTGSRSADLTMAASPDPLNSPSQLPGSLISQLLLVTALTSDRLIHAASSKQQLAQTYNADVVDMEGTAILGILAPLCIPVTMLRIVSDDADHDLPNINQAISAEGDLRPLPLAIGMIRQPIASARLIRGSLKGLQALRQVASQLQTLQ